MQFCHALLSNTEALGFIQLESILSVATPMISSIAIEGVAIRIDLYLKLTERI